MGPKVLNMLKPYQTALYTPYWYSLASFTGLYKIKYGKGPGSTSMKWCSQDWLGWARA